MNINTPKCCSNTVSMYISYLRNVMIFRKHEFQSMPSLLDTLEDLFQTRDLYETLGFPKASKNADRKNITENQIKKAYHKSSLKYHPDRAADSEREDATKKFQALGASYKILADPDSRALYDESGEIDDESGGIDENKDWSDYWRVLFQKVSI